MVKMVFLPMNPVPAGGGGKEQTEGDLGSVGGLKDRLRDEYMLG